MLDMASELQQIVQARDEFLKYDDQESRKAKLKDCKVSFKHAWPGMTVPDYGPFLRKATQEEAVAWFSSISPGLCKTTVVCLPPCDNCLSAGYDSLHSLGYLLFSGVLVLTQLSCYKIWDKDKRRKISGSAICRPHSVDEIGFLQ